MTAREQGSSSSGPASGAGRPVSLRQAAETALLLGVEFLPIGDPGSAARRAAGRPGAGAGAGAKPTADAAGGEGLEAERARRGAVLEALRERHDRECPHCTTATGHTRTVFGEGDPCAALMFVGEAPGADEDRTGRPFVGRAGELLTRQIEAMGLRREGVFIANVLKSRPLNNATPTPEEAARCGPYLLEQIGIVRPRALVALGGSAAHFLLDCADAVGSLRGRWLSLCRDGVGPIPVMVTYHPSFLLRAGTPENRGKVWSDLQQVMALLGGETGSAGAASPDEGREAGQ